MARNTDSNGYTIVFATAMVLIVGTLLAFLASSLKEKINENKRIEKQQNILYAMGVNNNDESSVEFISKENVESDFSTYITKQIVIEGTKITEDNNAYLIEIKRKLLKLKILHMLEDYLCLLEKRITKIITLFL